MDGVALIPDHGGVFIVTADGETIWDKEVYGADIDLELIVDAIDDRLPAEA
ncbi:Rdx family protein [Natronococcus wangiae]|uniref:Rdx family protein n=1 Tax=Natronococcus wangiae TaxID=3068275 RepID=UPI00387EE698